MKTLVIHPDDRSTDFLKPIYKNIPADSITVVTGKTNHEEILDHIKNHDRVIMMGHGSPAGLFGYNFDCNYVINHNHVSALKEKGQEAVYIWCNADQFVLRYGLKGLYSGMFISEVGEANACKLVNTTQEEVDNSNNHFANVCGVYINESIETIYKNVKYSYTEQAQYNAVAKYNAERLWMK